MVNGGGKAKDETVVTVESGDTLSELTAKLNEQNGTDYTYEEIALLNGITDPDTIYAGQTIVFPGTRLIRPAVALDQVQTILHQRIMSCHTFTAQFTRKRSINFGELRV